MLADGPYKRGSAVRRQSVSTIKTSIKMLLSRPMTREAEEERCKQPGTFRQLKAAPVPAEGAFRPAFVEKTTSMQHLHEKAKTPNSKIARLPGSSQPPWHFLWFCFPLVPRAKSSVEEMEEFF